MTWGGPEKADQEFDFSRCQVCSLLDTHIAGVEWPDETKLWNLRNRAGSEVELGSHPYLNDKDVIALLQEQEEKGGGVQS